MICKKEINPNRDEMELFNNEKYEIISVTLMNRAMDPNIEVTNKKYFSFQSENRIWWLGLFHISKESHETLNGFFSNFNTHNNCLTYNVGKN